LKDEFVSVFSNVDKNLYRNKLFNKKAPFNVIFSPTDTVFWKEYFGKYEIPIGCNEHYERDAKGNYFEDIV
jgi:hypothetical protein